MSHPSARSYLYVPADRDDRLERAHERGADALILDLEDAVAPDRKDAARAQVGNHVARLVAAGAQVWVRVNSGPRMLDDVRAAALSPIAGIVVPKARATTVLEVNEAIAATTNAASERPAIAALIESAAGVVEVRAIAKLGVAHLAIGEVDLAADLGIEPSPDRDELAPLRLEIVLASAAAGIGPPVAPVSTEFRDVAAFHASTERLKRAGFGARATIHPAQVEVVNAVFTPSEDEVERALALIARFDEAVAGGSGVVVGEDGRMVDEAVVRAARRTLALAELRT